MARTWPETISDFDLCPPDCLDFKWGVWSHKLIFHKTYNPCLTEVGLKTIRVINGPNLNMLGTREKEIYGDWTLAQIDNALFALAKELHLGFETFQTNNEGEYVELIQQSKENADFLILNPGAFTHTSIAIRDALLAIDMPAVELHLSNIYARESFRHKSYIGDCVIGRIMGFGPHSYLMAFRFAASYVKNS